MVETGDEKQLLAGCTCLDIILFITFIGKFSFDFRFTLLLIWTLFVRSIAGWPVSHSMHRCQLMRLVPMSLRKSLLFMIIRCRRNSSSLPFQRHAESSIDRLWSCHHDLILDSLCKWFKTAHSFPPGVKVQEIRRDILNYISQESDLRLYCVRYVFTAHQKRHYSLTTMLVTRR